MARTTEHTNDIAFRQPYINDVRNHRVTRIFRPGKRLCGDRKGYCPGDIVTLRVLAKVGAEWAQVPGLFRDDIAEPVEILDVVCKPLGSLEHQDFIGSTSDIHDQQSLRWYLGTHYNLLPDELDDDSFEVTTTTYRYLDV